MTTATIYKLLSVSLSLFDGAAGAAAGDGGESGTQGGSPAAPGATRRGKSGGELADVVYGKPSGQGIVSNATDAQQQAPDAGEKTSITTTSNTAEDKRKAFLELVNGEYKDVYTAETQRIINQRFKASKDTEEQLAAAKPVLDLLQQRYGTKDGDMAALAKAIDEDTAYWQDAADEAGMSVEQYKEVQRVRRENAELLKREQSRVGQERMQQQLAAWQRDAEAVKQHFPDFDLNDEVKNPEFLSLLRSGVPMEHAYKVLHMDQLMSDAMQTTAAATEKRVVENVRAKGARPAENGTSSQAGVTVKDDVSKLTAKDRAEIARRVARGEVISF